MRRAGSGSSRWPAAFRRSSGSARRTSSGVIGARATAGEAAHAAWQERRAAAILAGSKPTLEVRSITVAARTVNAGWDPVAIEDTGLDRSTRPRGTRFGTLVHAVLAGIDLADTAEDIRSLTVNH